MNQQQPENSDKAQNALIFLCIACRPWVMFWTVPRTPGWRYVGSIQAVWALGLVGVLALLNNSTGLGVIFLIGFLSQCEHRAKRSPNSHSYDMGRSKFTQWGINDTLGRYMEAIIAGGAGMALLEIDRPCGLFLMLTGFAEGFLVSFLLAKRKHQDADLTDALHEQRARAVRMEGQFGGS